jgi:hypothetical protein
MENVSSSTRVTKKERPVFTVPTPRLKRIVVLAVEGPFLTRDTAADMPRGKRQRAKGLRSAVSER